jgi:SAM-dependent methyltransferase
VAARRSGRQQAGLNQDVAQCGYCQPGQIMTAVSLVNELRAKGKRELSDADLDAIRNVCRCGTYAPIREAITEGAAAMPAAPGAKKTARKRRRDVAAAGRASATSPNGNDCRVTKPDASQPDNRCGGAVGTARGPPAPEEPNRDFSRCAACRRRVFFGGMSTQVLDSELKARHRAMWASGNYPTMVETFLLPIGERLAAAAAIKPGERVLDVGAGTGNTSIPAAAKGAKVTASDLTPELLDAGRARPEAQGLDIEWVPADAENLPFEDASYDVVMSSIGVMFAPHHQAAADEMARVCRPGGRIALLSWTPEGMLGALFAAMKPFAPPPPPGAQPPPLWGSEEHLQGLFGGRVDFQTLERDMLEITAFEHPHDYAEHFKAYYGPTIAARNNASKDGREGDFDAALNAFCDEWNRGTDERARFEKEYLVAVGTRR